MVGSGKVNFTSGQSLATTGFRRKSNPGSAATGPRDRTKGLLQLRHAVLVALTGEEAKEDCCRTQGTGFEAHLVSW
jgi:hypothetical protein